jgi:hypothetical protein
VGAELAGVRVRSVGVAIAIALTGAAVASGAGAQAQAGRSASQPKVLRSQVTTDPRVAAGEAWVVTNPRRPKRVAVIWLATRDSMNPANFTTPGYCGVAVSTDGGHSWRRNPLPFREAPSPLAISVAGEVPICGDPVAGVGPDGTLYAAAANVGSPSITQSLTARDRADAAWPEWGEPKEVFGAVQVVNAAAANPGHKTPAIAMGRASMAVDPVTGDVSVISQEDGGVEGRWLAVSANHGETWGPLVRSTPTSNRERQAPIRPLVGS